MANLQVKLEKYPWEKPGRCPCCGSRMLWGHGYVDRGFDGFPRKLPIKRYRCVSCGAVHTMRPDGYLPRFSAPESVQYTSIYGRLRKQKWLSSISRQRQQYWYKGFLKQAAAMSLGENLQDFLKRSSANRYPYVSHSINHSVKNGIIMPPHLSFAATAHNRPP